MIESSLCVLFKVLRRTPLGWVDSLEGVQVCQFKKGYGYCGRAEMHAAAHTLQISIGIRTARA
eukprot:3067955-Pleurochrysis_carterae.AAC.5